MAGIDGFRLVMDKLEITAALKAQAHSLGFALTGVCPAVTPTGWGRLAEWLDAGYAGQMDYLRERYEAYEHPRSVLDGVRSLLLLAMSYHVDDPRACESGQGCVSRYAWSDRDYHDVIHHRLKQLRAWYVARVPGGRARGVVDTAPLLEREFAQLAGLGWVGKNTLLLNRQAGSWFFLAALLVDQELAYDPIHASQHCGTCRACLDACPTQAFPQPYVLDATRCISYLTIELRGPIPRDLRPRVGDWVFGCDVCQTVCPWNHKADSGADDWRARADLNPLELGELFWLSDEEFRQRFRATSLWRPRRRGLLRNAAIVLGNQRAHQATAALVHGLADDESLVRGSCAWALGQLDTAAAHEALRRQHTVENDPGVREEIEFSLGRN